MSASTTDRQTSRFAFLKKMSSRGIRAHLAGLVVGCLLPVAAVAIFLTVDFYRQQQTELTVNATSRARALMSAVDRDFASTQAALQALGTSQRLANGDLSGFQMRATQELQHLRAKNIVVYDAAGQMLLNTELPYDPNRRPLESSPALKRIMEKGEPGISDLFSDPFTGRLNFAVTVPVKRDGLHQYSLMTGVEPAHVAAFLADQRFPASWRATVTDSSGFIVARTHDIETFLGKRVSSNMLRRFNAALEGGEQGVTLDGIAVLTVHSRSALTGWAVILAMPQDELTAGLRQTLVWLVAANLVALLAGVAWAWRVGGRVAASIQSLMSPALALGSGEAVAIPLLHFREANELRQALLEAANTLKQTEHRAHHDALTGLPNRVLFETVLNRQLALCRRNDTQLAILYIDLDGFKAVNDEHGHEVGDQLLQQVSVRIMSAIRESDIAARLGGDEFALALIHSEIESARAFGEQLIGQLSKTYQLGAVQANISASVGVAGYPASATDIDTLLIKADRAMYQAKALGKNRVCVAEL